MASRRPNNQNRDNDNFEQVLEIRRVSQKTKGGNKISFSALVVTGDRQGQVGLGRGKAPSVNDAIKKAVRLANRDLVKVPLVNGTVPYEMLTKFKAAKILLRPAPQGTGIIAGSAARAVVEAAGVTDIVCKILGGKNKSSNVLATFKALREIEKLGHKYQVLKAK